MVTKQRIKKENNQEQEIKKINNLKVDEIILQVEKDAKEEKLRSVNGMNSGGSAGKIGEKISMALFFILLAVAIIQSVELFNLRAQIAKGQFSTGTSVPAAGNSQGLPSQQGGC